MPIINFNPKKQAFERAARNAVKKAKELHALVRFKMGGRKYQASPKTSVSTLLWERARLAA